MSGNYALPPLPDRLTNQAFNYLDASGLANAAATNRGMHRLAPSIDSSAGRIQKFMQKYQGRDGGLNRVCDYDYPTEECGIQDSSYNGWVFGYLSRTHTYTTLFAPQKSFSSPVSLDRRFISRSEHHLFVRTSSHMEVYNLQGELLAQIPEEGEVIGCFELSYESNTLKFVKMDRNARLSVWEVKDNQKMHKVVEHTLPQKELFYITRCLRLGDLLILRTTSYSSSTWSYDLRNLHTPPKEIVHPDRSSFSNLRELFCSNSSQLFFIRLGSRSLLTYRAENGTFLLQWEKREVVPAPRAISFACASDRYVVVQTCLQNSFDARTSDRKTVISLEVFDTRSGQKNGSFICTFTNRVQSAFSFQIWHDDILVAQDIKGWHFWELPHGRSLHSIEIENSSPMHTFTSKQELLLILREKENNHLRLLDLSAMQPPAVASALPTMMLNPPANIPSIAYNPKRADPEQKVKETAPVTLFEAIYSYASYAFSWLTATLSRLWNKLFY